MVRPKKHLGQHFLTDHNIARKIVDQLSYRYPVAEVGPGTGILTQYLVEKKPSLLYLVEIDSEATEFLRYKFPGLQHYILEEDILKADLVSFLGNEFCLIGNFPYNISSQIFFRVLEYKNHCKELVGMVQKEVAQRIASGPGNKDYGILSVLLQAYYKIEYLFTVGENVFFPAPKVKSAVIRLVRNDRKHLPCPDEYFITVVKTAFNQRRKTLRNALSPLLSTPSYVSPDILSRRAESLSVEEFISLSETMFACHR